MANVSGTATSWACPNFVGELYLIGANKTPFLSMIGGLQGDMIRQVADFQFPLAQSYALETAAQPSRTENQAKTVPTATTYVREVDYNTCQIFHHGVEVTYAKQSVSGQITADPSTGLIDQTQNQPVQNERDFQINTALRQAAVNIEKTFLEGTYQQATTADVAPKCRGIASACSTNSVGASSARLSRTLLNSLIATMAGNGAEFRKPVIFAGAFQVQMISEIFGLGERSRTAGGVAITRVLLDIIGEVDVVWAPHITTTTLLLADLAVCRPVFLPVPEKGVLFYEELDGGGAVELGQIYGQVGLDYGPEEFHGKITSLATS
jgi:hypothetical protein